MDFQSRNPKRAQHTPRKGKNSFRMLLLLKVGICYGTWAQQNEKAAFGFEKYSGRAGKRSQTLHFL